MDRLTDRLTDGEKIQCTSFFRTENVTHCLSHPLTSQTECGSDLKFVLHDQYGRNFGVIAAIFDRSPLSQDNGMGFLRGAPTIPLYLGSGSTYQKSRRWPKNYTHKEGLCSINLIFLLNFGLMDFYRN